jgi:hypothetical protein
LSTRRKVKKLLLFYKIVNKEAPDYLYELVPPLVAANVNYNLRNSHNIRAASICIFSRRLQFACPQLSQTSEAYSKIGRMKTKYIFSLIIIYVTVTIYMYLLIVCLFTKILTFHVLFKHGILWI